MHNLRMFGSANLKHETQCLRPCRRTAYTLERGVHGSPYYEGEVYSMLTLHKQQGETATDKQEVLEYTLSDLLSDVGGMMGLFLGMSIWGLANDIKALIQALLTREV